MLNTTLALPGIERKLDSGDCSRFWDDTYAVTMWCSWLTVYRIGNTADPREPPGCLFLSRRPRSAAVSSYILYYGDSVSLFDVKKIAVPSSTRFS